MKGCAKASRPRRSAVAGRRTMVAVAAPMASRDRPGRHEELSGRIMRAKNALISGEASVSSSAISRRRSRLLVALTIAGPVIAAVCPFFLGARFGRCT